MQFKLAFVTAVLATLAVATPTFPRGGEPASSCSTGPVQCCNTVEPASSAPPQDLTVDVGLTCDPITVIGVGSGSWITATCFDSDASSLGTLISIGCVPVTL
ncbi:fungal hydrophobin [Gymnopus androsaceus JB14]|uniref:Hydrophobin n=1 Tax=Gymnopus androsaceus JB14 TaxID=1447944 RepID=A0A6A4IC57_9AGAR|nr:fungal hydrophobin [Gymnopus androsaceus JB14]